MDDDGWLHVTGRDKDVINRGGETISPIEIEEALGTHPFLGGAVAGRSIAPESVTVQAVLGAVGMFAALMVEALLFMLRDAKT